MRKQQLNKKNERLERKKQDQQFVCKPNCFNMKLLFHK